MSERSRRHHKEDPASPIGPSLRSLAACGSLGLALFVAPAVAQVTVGQIDQFDGITTDFWERGDNVDNQLVVTGDGDGSQGRIVTFNVIQWSGDYLAAGVDTVRFQAENLGSQEPLVVRLAFGDQLNPATPGSTWYCSVAGFELLPGQSGTLSFPIDPPAFVSVQGAASVEDVMPDGRAMRILCNPEPSARGAIALGFLALDDIAAIGQGTTDAPALALAPALAPAYPNPFNPATTLSFRLPSAQHAVLMITDLRGRHVQTLVQGALPAGEHTVRWNGLGAAGRPVASGVYLARLRAGDHVQSQRLTLLK